MNHNEIVQRLTAVKADYWISGEWIQTFQTEKEMVVSRGAGIKTPDALWHILFEDPLNEGFSDLLKPKKRVAIEVELSPKWNQELDTFVYLSLRQLKDGVCEGVEIYAQSPALLARYEKAFKPGTSLQTWTKTKGKASVWVKGFSVTIPDRADGVVRFTLLTPKLLGR